MVQRRRRYSRGLFNAFTSESPAHHVSSLLQRFSFGSAAHLHQRLPVELGEHRERLLRAGRRRLGQKGRTGRHVARAANALDEHHAVPVLAERVLLLRRLLEPTPRRGQVLRHALAVEVRLAEGRLRPALAALGSLAEPGPGGGATRGADEAAVAAGCVSLVVVRERAALALSPKN